MKCAVIIGIFCLIATPLLADYEVFYENGKAGIRDDAGNVLIPASYDALGWSDGSFSVVNNVTGYRKDARWGLINLKKELITAADFDNLTSGGGDRVVASRWINPYTKKFGCVNLEGKVTVPFHYDALQILGLRAIACVRNGSRYEYGLIDLNNKTVLKIAYRGIRPVGSLRFAVENFEGKNALLSEEGVLLTDFVIDSISAFRKGYAKVYQDLKVGLLDRFGELIVQPTYRDIGIASDGSVSARPFPLWTEIDTHNTKVRSVSADELQPEGEYFHVTISGRHGTSDRQLKPVINPVYSALGAFSYNKAIAFKEGKCGLIRDDGRIVIPFEHDSLFIQKDLVRSLRHSGDHYQWSVYNTFGIKKTQKVYEKLEPYNGRFFPARRNGYWGTVDRYGNEFIGCVYDEIINSTNDHVAVKFKGLYGIIDMQEKWIVPLGRNPLSLATNELYFERSDSITFVKDFYQQILYFTTNQLLVHTDGFREITAEGNVRKISWQGISSYEAAPPTVDDTEQIFEESEGLRGVKRDGRFGFIDQRGRLRIANRYEAIHKFSEGLAAVMIRGKWGFINTTDQIVVNPNYDHVTEFRNGVCLVTKNKYTGLLSADGTVLLPLRYDSIAWERENLILVHNNKLGLAAPSGHVLIEPRFSSLRIAADNLVIVSDGSLWGVLSYDGMPVIPMIYNALRYDEHSGHFLAKEERGWQPIVLTQKAD